MAFRWTVHGDGKTVAPGQSVRPDERLSWPRTAGFGAQHVVAMFGATFVFPRLMGINPQFGVMMSGVATIIFLLIVKGKVPSYLGTSAAFVAASTAIYALPGADSSQVTGAIMVAGLILAAVGVVIHFLGAPVVSAVLPPVVTGGVVMLIGFNLAPVVASVYWPVDQWVAVITMVVVIALSVGFKGMISRISILLGLIVGTLLSWLLDAVDGGGRLDLTSVREASWIGFPGDITVHTATATQVLTGPQLPTFSATAILLVIPGVIALIAENAGHVKAVGEMTGTNLDPYLGRAILGDGVATALAGFVGSAPTTTYAENIGVMAATRVYSTAAYYVAAAVAILFGFSPKFGALVAAIPGGVIGGITVVLYGMIGLLGAKIWVENRVDFGNPVNLVPVAAGLIIGIGGVTLKFSDQFSLSGIALGTLVTVVMYHFARLIAPKVLAAGK